jgi:hypothetical protein
MSKNTIKINGNELKRRIEDDLGRSIYDIATNNGYSRNLIAQAIRTGKASPVVQTLLKLYGITPEEYEIKDPEPPKKGQISFDDIEELSRSELKSLIKETILETLEDFICKGINSYYDPVNKIYTINIKIK